MTVKRIRIERMDDEHVVVFADRTRGPIEIAYANHDEHGWAGMDMLERAAREFAAVFDVPFVEA